MQQLDEEGFLSDLGELLDFGRLAVGELDAVHPLRDQQAARGQVIVDLVGVGVGAGVRARARGKGGKG